MDRVDVERAMTYLDSPDPVVHALKQLRGGDPREKEVSTTFLLAAVNCSPQTRAATVPPLLRGMLDRNPAVRLACAFVLRSMRLGKEKPERAYALAYFLTCLLKEEEVPAVWDEIKKGIEASCGKDSKWVEQAVCDGDSIFVKILATITVESLFAFLDRSERSQTEIALDVLGHFLCEGEDSQFASSPAGES